MADEIRIHLSTYLKDAGIKASQQQINRLANDVKKLNADMQSGTDKTAESLGKLPGAFGKLQGVVSGFGAKALAVIGAFKVGWEIGTWLNDNVVRPLFNIQDPIEELKKHNRQLKAECEAAAKAWESRMSKLAASWEEHAKAAQKAAKHVDDLTRAYLQMQKAREQVANAGNDAELLGLQRDKFNAMSAAQTPEEATALGHQFDAKIAEAEARHKLEQFDRDAESRTKQLRSEESKLRIATRNVNRLNADISKAEKKIAYLESDQSDRDMGPREADAALIKMQERLKNLKKLRADAEADEDRQRRTVEAARVAATADPQERENLIAANQLAIDEKRKAYDDYIAHVQQQEEEAAQAAAEAEQRAAEAEWVKEQEQIRKAIEEERREREKMEQQLAAQRIADLRAELSERQRMEGEAQSRQSAAASGLQTAWGWYRNQAQMQAVIDEKKAQQLAEEQWAKDFDNLKFRHRDWREIEFGKLSAADESVRQVALAKEEKEAADRAVIETAENTRNLADKLDELLQVKG